MPHISKQHLESEEFFKIYNELIKAFEIASKDSKGKEVFKEFFTRTEKIMFAKRLAIIAMLSKGESTYEISQKLKISPSTADRMQMRFERGDYEVLAKIIANKKSIMEQIELFILTTGGLMPPITGHSRVRELKKKN